jgi:hypothetical protein
VGTATFTTIPGQCRDLSTEITRQLEDTLSAELLRLIEDTPSTEIRAAFGLMPSAGTTMVARPEAFRRAEAPASVVEADFTVVEAEDFTAAVVEGGGDRGFARFPKQLVRERNGEMLYAADGAEIRRTCVDGCA